MNLSNLSHEAQEYLKFEISLLPSLEGREDEVIPLVLEKMEKPLWDIMSEWLAALKNVKTPFRRPVGLAYWNLIPEEPGKAKAEANFYQRFKDSKAATELFPVHIARLAYKARVIMVSGENEQGQRDSGKVAGAPRRVRHKLLRSRGKETHARAPGRAGSAL